MPNKNKHRHAPGTMPPTIHNHRQQAGWWGRPAVPDEIEVEIEVEIEIEIFVEDPAADTGDPTDNCLYDAQRIFRLLEDERYFSAQALHESVCDRIRETIGNGNGNGNGSASFALSSSRRSGTKRSAGKQSKSPKKKAAEERNRKAALELLNENQETIRKMEDRCRLFQKAKINLENDADWTLAQTLFGVTTFYRHESDGSMSVKLEGTVRDCPMFEQLAVLREVDLNYLWAPFVTSSTTVAHLDKLDIVGWFLVGLPTFGLIRDSLFRAIGCDSIYEDGSIMIIAHGIADRPDETKTPEKGNNNNNNNNNDDNGLKSSDSNLTSSLGKMGFDAVETRIIEELRSDPILETLDLPPVPTRMGGGRLTLRSFAAQIHLESTTTATTTIIANIDPNLFLVPKPLLDFVMKRMCGVILHKMQAATINIPKDPITNLHAIRMREDEFYKNFLLPKFEGVCKTRGWKMPTISAFGLSDAQLEMSELFMSKQKYKSEVKVVKHFGATEDNLDEYLEVSSPRNRAKGEATISGSGGSESGPKVPTRDMHKDLDDMSDISKNSTLSFWQTNPIANYKRQLDEKSQRKKLREIEEARVRAANRLKPKSLDEDSALRLRELRAARDRQKALANQAQTQTDDEDEDAIVTRQTGAVGSTNLSERTNGSTGSSRRWKISLRSHGLFTKIFVLQFLMVSLFCLLYLDTPFEKFVAVRGDSFLIERRRDLATFVYMGVSGLIHAVFCYVAMIYAFSALQLGLIAGKRTRKFYSEYVHYAVAFSTASMVGLGVVKPGVDKILRWTIWSIHSISKVAKMALLPKIPDKIIAALQLAVNAIISVIFSTQELILESNIFGRCLVSAVKTGSGFMLRTFRQPFATYADTAIKQYEGSLNTIPWREDSFYTTRALLSHSAFFLLVLLFLFDASAKKARKAIYVEDGSSSESSSSKTASG
eukprot:jgi/Psemu1/289925/fgenesh1_pg.425_\